MVAYSVLILLAAAATAPSVQSPAPAQPETAARASSRATVRIVRGARIELGESADRGNYVVSQAHVRDETGRSRPAQLVEFQ